MWHPKKNLDPFLPVFSHFFMSYFDVLGSIFEIWAITDLPNIIVSMCLVSYNICMIPHVCKVTFGLNLSGAWGELLACLTITITCTAVSHRFINEVNQHCLDSWNGNLARSEKRSNFVLTPWRWLCMMIRREICRLSGHLSWPLHSIHTPSLRRSE